MKLKEAVQLALDIHFRELPNRYYGGETDSVDNLDPKLIEGWEKIVIALTTMGCISIPEDKFNQNKYVFAKGVK